MIRYWNCYSTWRVLASCKNCKLQLLRSSLSSSTNLSPDESINQQAKKNLSVKSENSSNIIGTVANKSEKISIKNKSKLISAAFNSLNAQKPQNLMEKLQAATTVNNLLLVTEAPQFTQYHALQALSILTSWTTEKKIKMSDFESDPRFVNLCKMLGRRKGDEFDTYSDGGDLALVLGVTGGDQAAKLVSSITLPQKLKVLSTLAFKKRRTVPLLKALASDIGNSSKNFNVKEAADILYAMSVLNFPDDVLLNKAATDIYQCLNNNKNSAVVGSILTSVGLLKYKNKVLLDALSEWVKANLPICREQDLVSFLLTLASVNHHPLNGSEIYQVVVHVLSNVSLKPLEWLDVVWALTVLNKAEVKHVQSVLDPNFIQKLYSFGGVEGISASIKKKLLNINAAAQYLIQGYQGPLLSDSKMVTDFPLQRTREKQLLVDSVVDALSNLFSSSTYLNTNVDTGFGFLIDGVCAVDHKCNPIPVSNDSVDKKRIAIYVCDYHDMCRGSAEVCGPVSLHLCLLRRLGYSVISITYLNFNPGEKLIKRVKYLEKQFKDIAKEDG